MDQPSSAEVDYSQYASDPVAFGVEVLGHTYTPDVERLMRTCVESPVTIGHSSTGVGKSYALADLAVWWWRCFDDAAVYITCAPPEENLRDHVWKHIIDIRSAHLEIFAGARFPPRDMEIERAGARLRAFAIPVSASDHDVRERVRGKHAAHQLFLVDEANTCTPPLFDGIKACMVGAHERAVYCFNPDNDSGPVAIMERNGTGNVVTMCAFDHPNVKDGNNAIPGAVTREATVQRINAWSSPAKGGDRDTFEVPECLVGCVALKDDGTQYPLLPGGLRTITDPQLAYSVLAQYPRGGVWSYFDAAYLRGLLDDPYEPLEMEGKACLEPGDHGISGWYELYENCEEGHSYVWGADVAEGLIADDRDWHAADCIDCLTGTHVASYWGRGDPDQYANDLLWLTEEWQTDCSGPAMLIVERTGVGVAVVTALSRLGVRQYAREVTRTVSGQKITLPELGFSTNNETKQIVDACLRAGINAAASGSDAPMIRGQRVIEQCIHYVDLPGGKRGAERPYHDDHPRSFGLAWWWRQEYGYQEALARNERWQSRRKKLWDVDESTKREEETHTHWR
jgi:hypothetical protein